MPEMSKVLHLIAADCEWENAMRVATLAAALREHGFQSAVTAPEHSRLWEFAEAAGVEVVPYALENSINPLRWRDLAKMLESRHPALVHAHDPEAASLLHRAGRFGAPAAAATTRCDARTQPGSAEYAEGVGAVVCPSLVVADAFSRILPADGRIRVVHAGVNLATADRSTEERDDLRARFRNTYCPHKEKPLFLVNLAPIEEESRQSEILEALAECVAALPQTHLFIMGEGEREEELRSLLRIMALEKDVSILEPDRAYPQLLAAADLYVSASLNEATGFMVQSAMAAGRAAALSGSGCHPELAENGKNAALADPKEEGSLKRAILDLLENRGRREHLGRQAKAAAGRLFDATKQAGTVAEIYRGIRQG